MTNQALSLRILELVGGRDNIRGATNCMTRLRVDLKDYTKVNLEGLNAVEDILQVVEMDNLHIVLGPGKAKRVTDQFLADAGICSGAEEVPAPPKSVPEIHRLGCIRAALMTVGDLFVPLLPGVIGAGVCGGLAILIAQLFPDDSGIGWLLTLHQMLNGIYTAFLWAMPAWVGYRAGEKFGATPILGGLLGVLPSGEGGILGVILGVLLLSRVEKFVRARMPDTLDAVVSPVVILAVTLAAYVWIIVPLAGLLSGWLGWILDVLLVSGPILIRMAAGFLGALLYLPLISMGLHHCLVPLYLLQLEHFGFVALYPALAMAGAGQVGAVLAIRQKAKKVGNGRILSVIDRGLPAGILGVGEPLIYGVTQPLGKPFLTAGLGAGFGGAFCMAMGVTATAWGPSGLLALPIMVCASASAVRQMLWYFTGLVISYTLGWCFTMIGLKDREVANG